MTTVLIACDKFKGSLTAPEVCDAVAEGIRAVRPDATVIPMPIADGGDGTVAAAVGAGYRHITLSVTGPSGQPVSAGFALHPDGGTAVIEMAQASGLLQLAGGIPDPLGATSYGTGELVVAALDAGARRIVLAVGGSASTDGGAGFLQALGARLTAGDGTAVAHGGGALDTLASVDLTSLDRRLAGCEIVLASDVDNPLLGHDGAASVYGPQKGAGAEEVEILEEGLAHLVRVMEGHGVLAGMADFPGAGAAGGIGYAALAVLGATRQPGIDVVMEITGYGETVAALGAGDLVVTGEGSLDPQTLSGKAVAGLAAVARDAGVPVIAVCGQGSLTAEQLGTLGIQGSFPLTDLEPDTARCMSGAAALLAAVGRNVGTSLVAERVLQ
ncbi:glycerate kinase [Pseudarthrobacter sp. NPDC092439]|uniref:glycerate kinase n=1 Tax=unclassified Pseudarthrobacter TaxID=2647000 RepID=UPI003826079F